MRAGRKRVFILKEDGALVPLKPAQFVLEDDFQRLLEDYPELLVGDLIDSEEPRRWVLVAREFGIAKDEDSASWWSADHLFLDQDGIPTIVEVKRQTDSRLRREVIGQMLDYAAHGVSSWTIDSIRAQFEATCAKKAKDPEQELQSRLGDDIEPAKFWGQVKTNLEAQKLRLLFVADVIPRELRRVVEFLNRQMDPVEVLALELRQYSGENGLKTIAPTLFGQTEDARSKSTPAGASWDEASFFRELAAKSNPAVVESARKILTWMEKNATRVVYGRGRIEGSFTCYFLVNGLKLYPMTLWTQGRLLIDFHDCMKPPFDEEEKRKQLLQRLNTIPDVNLPPDCITRYPSIQMSTLAQGDRTEQLLSVMDWFASQLTI